MKRRRRRKCPAGGAEVRRGGGEESVSVCLSLSQSVHTDSSLRVHPAGCYTPSPPNLLTPPVLSQKSLRSSDFWETESGGRVDRVEMFTAADTQEFTELLRAARVHTQNQRIHTREDQEAEEHVWTETGASTEFSPTATPRARFRKKKKNPSKALRCFMELKPVIRFN
ncbi:unnamed protein product [Pleuronectes platessa]|uniref:Uncharacterized protein n=1 Tax=Pleuronectes platessa TaxID=8262 RepID=A0A9N7TLE8_PLEPL|nr:unnamed protein product [Pleuronectes platessa]